MTLNKKEIYVELGGCLPVKYVQDGKAFNPAGEYLFDCDGAGNRVQTSNERAELEAQAEALGVKFRSNTGDDKLRERIATAESAQYAESADGGEDAAE